MKCPHCGVWNQASLPRCFRCGQPLDPVDTSVRDWQKEFADDSGREKIIYDISDTGENKKAEDDGDTLAEEMEKLRIRKQRGQEEQRRLRTLETQPYSARLAGRIQQSTTRRRYVIDSMEDLRQTPARHRRSARSNRCNRGCRRTAISDRPPQASASSLETLPSPRRIRHCLSRSRRTPSRAARWARWRQRAH